MNSETEEVKTTKETKTCKYCQSEIPKKAKICPVCRKKQGGKAKGIVIGIVVLFFMIVIFGGSDDNSSSKAKKTGEIDSSDNKVETTANESNNEQEEVKSNIFHVGDIVETEKLKITYLSSNPYVSENEFIQPKEGYEYWEFELKFENISSEDQHVSSMMDWECYADNTKVDQSWIGDDNGLDATLSSGRTAQGKIYFEVPQDAKSIELEYDINFWQSDKIIFVAK